ncbi:hypothetical protein PHLCEN_2v10 [Hermanssonia centrifuga]|uniref:BTB domain-containing protein n=1 Tax=Hermanssonia centrifuga TaxID=98765 RepID=A0A2R6S786_9APHY|nr:hypothetical protein PHLCEN_2v10 [Hermanssonia centrifuga]
MFQPPGNIFGATLVNQPQGSTIGFGATSSRSQVGSNPVSSLSQPQAPFDPTPNSGPSQSQVPESDPTLNSSQASAPLSRPKPVKAPSIIFQPTDTFGPSAETTEALHDALAQSLGDDGFLDIIFHVFTRKLPSGRVCKPRAVYSNSRILKSSSVYFRGLLSGGFAESTSLSTTGKFPSNQDEYTDAYEFDSDSDLEEGLDDDEVPAVSPIGEPPAPSVIQGIPPSSSAEAASPQLKRAVVIRSAAADTWQALMFYIYTHKVYFLPLQSNGSNMRQQARSDHEKKYLNRPMCSPKSMYRLADIVGIEELKSQAQTYILSQLCADNILEEIFSSFSSEYAEILKEQTDIFCKQYLNDEAMRNLHSKIQVVAEGRCPHGTRAIMSLLEHLPRISGQGGSLKSGGKKKK